MKSFLKFLYKLFKLEPPPELTDAPKAAQTPVPTPAPAPPVAPVEVITAEQAVARAKVEILREQAAAAAAAEAAKVQPEIYRIPAPVPPPPPPPPPIAEATVQVMTQCASSYPSAQALRDACANGHYQYAVTLDERPLWTGFGPAENFFTQPDGSVNMNKPVVAAPPPPPKVEAPRALPLPSYPTTDALVADFAALKLNTAVLLDGVVVVEGFGPPFKYVLQGASPVRT